MESEEECVQQKNWSSSFQVVDRSEESVRTAAAMISSRVEHEVLRIMHQGTKDRAKLSKIDLSVGFSSGTIAMNVTSHTARGVSSGNLISMQCERDTMRCYDCSTGIVLVRDDECGGYKFVNCELCKGTGFIHLKSIRRYDVALDSSGALAEYELDEPLFDGMVEYLMEVFGMLGLDANLEDHDDEKAVISVLGHTITFQNGYASLQTVGRDVSRALRAHRLVMSSELLSEIRQTLDSHMTRCVRRFFRIRWSRS